MFMTMIITMITVVLIVNIDAVGGDDMKPLLVSDVVKS